MSRLTTTDVGRQVALSGLLPETAADLLSYFVTHGDQLANLLQAAEPEKIDHNDFDYIVLYACLSSPEFTGLTRTRFLPPRINSPVDNPYPDRVAGLLKEKPWRAYRDVANASALLVDWMNGASLTALERRFPMLRAGGIQNLAREAAWCLSGISNILSVALKPDVPASELPPQFLEASTTAARSLRKILYALRLLVWRLNVALPAEALWIAELRDQAGRQLVSRREALSMHANGVSSYADLLQSKNWPGVIDALRKAGVSNMQTRAEEIQEAARNWHLELREKYKERLGKRLGNESFFVNELIDHREKKFEAALEAFLTRAGIRYTKFDDGSSPGQFDYLLHFDGRMDLVLECKTKQGNSLIDLKAAREVLASAAQYGKHQHFCITLCNPGINPDVLTSITDCVQLAIVEAHDMADALTRICNSRLSLHGFYDWLSRPGLIKSDELISFTGTTLPDAGTTAA